MLRRGSLVLGACLFIGLGWGATVAAQPAPSPASSRLAVETVKPGAPPPPLRVWRPGALMAEISTAATAAASGLKAASAAAPRLPRLKPPNIDLVYAIAAAVFAFSILGLLVVRGMLAKSPGWSLGDALSEEVDLTNDQGAPIKVMRASASRLIAFSGLLVMLFLYFGFGMFLLYFFGTGQKVPQDVLDGIQKFMLAGLALFAPYAVNQFRAAMNGAASTAAASAAQPKARPPNATPQAIGQARLKQLQAPAQALAAEDSFQGGC